MKRQGWLTEKIAAMDNLQLAFYKAQKGKAGQPAVYQYGKKLQIHLYELQQQLKAGQVETGHYHYFTIYDPKERLVCEAPFPQRVMHHALMNICHPFFERFQIVDSYASRLGKGTYAALDRAKMFHKRYRWFLKLDFRKYFDSLKHLIIKQQLAELFKDPILLSMLYDIVDSYSLQLDKGVPIGNLTSQYFANHYLAPLDHYIKEKLKIKAYIRYMDDLVLWHNDKESLLNAGIGLQHYAESELFLALKPFCLNRNAHGLPFLGYLLYPDTIRLAHRSRIRFIRKLERYEGYLRLQVWSEKEYQNHVSPLIAFADRADAKEFRKNILANV